MKGHLLIFLAALMALPSLSLKADGHGVEPHRNPDGPRPYYESERLADSNMGSYRFRVGALRPHFTEDFERVYDAIWGNTNWTGHIAIDWTPLRFWWFGVGAGFKFHYYTDKGFSLDSADLDNLQVNRDGETRFNMYPVELDLVLTFSPFYERFVTLQAWAGWEYLYATTVRESGEGEDLVFLKNSAKTNSLAYGVALDVGLGWLDTKMIRALENSFGIGQVYLSIFVERTMRLNTDKDGVVPINRDILGLGFTFESKY